jgi:hypothetical protein
VAGNNRGGRTAMFDSGTHGTAVAILILSSEQGARLMNKGNLQRILPATLDSSWTYLRRSKTLSEGASHIQEDTQASIPLANIYDASVWPTYRNNPVSFLKESDRTAIIGNAVAQLLVRTLLTVVQH